MRLDTSLSDSIAAATKAATAKATASTQKSSGQSSFKSVLKAAATDTTTSSSSSSTSTPAANPAETTQAVPGHMYAEILTGPRAGMYVNTSHNKRNGQAFVMVERNGVEYHVYGTGKHRTVVEMRRHTPAPATTSSPTKTSGSVTPDTGTATTPAPTTSGTSSTGVTAGKITTDTSTL